jgi:hypothetical protein
MSVSGIVALLGAGVAVVAIRAKTKGSTTIEEAEAAVRPGGSAVTAIEQVDEAAVA